MSSSADFSVWPFRFHFLAEEAVYFPEGNAANVIRGAFGTLFRGLACAPACSDAKSCDVAATCPYALIFEPRQQWSHTTGPSGLADWPRPFVFRALHLDGCRLAPHAEFHFDLILFEPPAGVLRYFVLAFRQLAEAGLGPLRGRAALVRVEDLSTRCVADEGGYPGLHFALTKNVGRTPWSAADPLVGLGGTRASRADQAVRPTGLSRVVIQFLTPTELKAGGELVKRPEFPVFLRRLRDRVSNLRSMYQAGPLEIDFEELGRQAEQVAIVRSSLEQVSAERRSSRTGQRHPLGGFLGEVEYSGDLARFLPLLRAGEWTGVGRQTVWGKGCYSLML